MEIFNSEKVEAYVYQEAKQGNRECGDAYYLYSGDDYFICAIADGLGSGPNARQSAIVVPEMLEKYHNETPDELLLRCNEQMVKKRGAAVAIVKADYHRQVIQYSCVGNVRFYMLHNQLRMIYPLPVMGYLSGRPQKLRTQEYAYQRGDLFFLHSDGVVLKSPKALLKGSLGPYELYHNVLETIEHGDDVTFIAGSLLL